MPRTKVFDKDKFKQTGYITTHETYNKAITQSEKLFGKPNLTGYLDLIINLDAATGIIERLRGK